MDIFDFRGKLIDDYAAYTRSFITVREPNLRQFVGCQRALKTGHLGALENQPF